MDMKIVIAVMVIAFITVMSLSVYSVSAATGNKGGFAIGGFNAAIINLGEDIKDTLNQFKEKVKTNVKSLMNKAQLIDSMAKSTDGLTQEDMDAILEAIERGEEINITVELVNKTIKFKAGSDLAKTVKSAPATGSRGGFAVGGLNPT